MEPKEKSKREYSAWRSVFASISNIFKSIILILLLSGIGGIVIGSYIMLHVIDAAPNLDVSKIYLLEPVTMYDRHGVLIDERGIETSNWVNFHDISPVMIDAILATEDADFFNHIGVDWRRTLIAQLHNLNTILGDGSGIQGGSTITQQLIKMSHLDDTRAGWEGIERKVQEIYLSFQIEEVLTKEQILTAYLNLAPFGGGIYGVQRAANFYFGVDAADLTLSQAATLAGLVQLPNQWRPDVNPDNAEHRRDLVLTMMVGHGFISQELAHLAMADPITDNLVLLEEELPTRHMYQSYIDSVLDELYTRFGLSSVGGLQIFTNLDRQAQAHLYEIQNTNNHIRWDLTHDLMQSGIAFIETQTGRVRAVGGGHGRNEGERGMNRATGFGTGQNGFQIGSTAKSIFAYGPGIEYLGWGTGSVFVDQAMNWPGTGISINNFHGRFSGPMTIRQALDSSYNTPAAQATIRVLNTIGQEGMLNWLERLGIAPESLPIPGYVTPGTGLGTAYLSPLQMAAAYAAFGNGGIYNEPFFIDRIVMSNGTVLYGEDERTSHRAMSVETAWMNQDMLRSVMTNGTGNSFANAGLWGMNLAGKTGTTNHENRPDLARDSWFVGFSGEFTTAVWVGFDYNFDENENLLHIPTTWNTWETFNQAISGRVFNRVMAYLNPWGTQLSPRPYGVQPFVIDTRAGENGTAYLAASTTPERYRRQEWFRIGTGPTQTSTYQDEEEYEEDYDEYDDYNEEDYYYDSPTEDVPYDSGGNYTDDSNHYDNYDGGNHYHDAPNDYPNDQPYKPEEDDDGHYY